MAVLQLENGPDCPDCGCRASSLLRTAKGWYGPVERRACENCGREFPAPHQNGPVKAETDPKKLDSGVIYRPLRCTRCQSRNLIITDTRGPIRRHKCRDCSHTFKSVDEDAT